MRCDFLMCFFYRCLTCRGAREYRCGICTSLFFAGLLGVTASLAGPVLPRCFSLVSVTSESVPRSARCGCSWRSDCCQQDLIGVGVDEALLAPLRCDNCSSTDLNSCNIYLWSWGSTLERPPFFRLLFFPFFSRSLSLSDLLMRSTTIEELVAVVWSSTRRRMRLLFVYLNLNSLSATVARWSSKFLFDGGNEQPLLDFSSVFFLQALEVDWGGG